MMQSSQHRVLIAGGGVAALETVLALRALAGDRVDIQMLAPNLEFLNRPSSVREPFGTADSQHFELTKIAEDQGATFHHGTLAGVDHERHTARTLTGTKLPYDSLVITVGALRQRSIEGAVIFGGSEDKRVYTRFLEEALAGELRDIVFAVPAGINWPLPLYELALLTEHELRSNRVEGVNLTFATPEPSPLHMFGRAVGEHLEGVFEQRGITLRTNVFPDTYADGQLTLRPNAEQVRADSVVTIPVLSGPSMPGLPHDQHGFLSIDTFGHVRDVKDVFAVGDACDFMVKQGGIATQQADAAAEQIAAEVGVDLTPEPFKPVARAILYTGDSQLFIQAELIGGRGEQSKISHEALWQPPGKIAGKYLMPFLASFPSSAAESPPSNATSKD